MAGAGALEQQAEQLYRMIVERHIAAEPQTALYSLLAIPLGLLVFTLLTWRYPGHLRGLRDRVAFFFRPFPPQWFIEIVDVYGVHHSYDLELLPGRRYWVIRVKGREYRVLGDPRRFAVPVGLIDMKSSQPGVPSPFGYVSRLLLSWIIVLVFAAYGWAYTAYLSISAYHINPTWIDVLTTVIFTVVILWFILNVLRFNSETGLALWMVELPGSGLVVPAMPGPDRVAEWRNVLVESLGEARCELSEKCQKLLEALQERAPEKAAEIVLAKAVDAEHWRRRYAALEEELEQHIDAAIAAAQRAPRGPAEAPAPRRLYLLLAAIGLLAAAALIIALQPSVHSLHNATTTAPVTPAQPVPPPQQTTPMPAQPPTPPGASGNVTVTPPAPPPPPGAGNATVTAPSPPPPPPPQNATG